MKKLLFILLALLLFTGSAFGVTVFSDDFESGSLGSQWSTYTTENGRVRVMTGTAYAGSYSVKMDCSATGTFSYAAPILTLDLSGYTGSTLNFHWREYGDENHDGDGVFISKDNGSTWTKVLSFNNGPTAYKSESLNISALDGVANAKIKFQFYDNWYMTSDGYAVDNVSVTATASGGSTPPPTGTWTAETKNVSSANYPSDYPNNVDKTDTFTKSGATKMRVHFSAFATESGYDKVYILNGAGTVLATYDGSKGAFTSAEVDGDTIKVRFTSDGSVVAAGWKIDKIEYLGEASGGDDPVDPPPTGGGTEESIFSDNFESGSLGSQWTTYTTANGQVRVMTGTAHAGSYSVKMDCSTSGTYSYAAPVLTLDLSQYSSTKLNFYWREYGDENHDGDGVFISADGGSTWTKVLSFNNGPTAYRSESLDISALDGKANAKIKFQFYDNWYMTSDGYAIDDVEVRGVKSGSTPPAVTPSSRGGMGAIPYSGGVTFRVWAPNGTAVAVAGDFNSWSGTANAMASEGNGYWSVDVPGAVANQQYKFAITYNGNQLWKNDPYSREMTTSVGNSIIKDRNYTWASFNMPSWGELVIYEVHPRTFNYTFDGLAAKAGYLKDSLAVNSIEVMPAAEFPGDVSWGYNPAHIFAVESSYGGYTAYKNMVNTMHQNGIAVIQDVVHNHYGPSDLDLWCFDGPSFGNGGIYFYTDWKKTTPWGDSRPDYGRGEVRAFIKDNAMYWLGEMNTDGLRWDATVYIRKTAYDGSEISDGWSLLQYVHNEKNSQFGWKISIAEDLQNDSWVTKSTGEGGAGFDSQWHADFLHKMRGELTKGNDSDRDMNVVRDQIAWMDNGNSTKLVKYTESHDECSGNNGKQRLTQDIDAYNARSYYAKKRAGIGALLAILSPGIPMIFQGQENLETGNWSDNTFFSWADTVTYAGYVQMYRDAIRLKRNWYNTTRGFSGNGINVFHVNNTAKVVAFHRWQNGGNGDDVIVVVNFGNTAYSSYNIGTPSSGTWYCRYNSDWNGYSSDFGNFGGYNTTGNSGGKDGLGYNMNVALGKYAVLIFSK